MDISENELARLEAIHCPATDIEQWAQDCYLCGEKLPCDVLRLIAAYRKQVAKPSIDDCLHHRCFEHRAVPQQNANEFSGAECGGCIAAERDEAKGLLEVEQEMCRIEREKRDFQFERANNAEAGARIEARLATGERLYEWLDASHVHPKSKRPMPGCVPCWLLVEWDEQAQEGA